MRLIVVRHGQTDHNKNEIVAGQEANPPLNSTGLAQVKNLFEVIKQYQFDKIISSPLLRATQTAQMLADNLGKKIEFDDRLKERAYGSFSGKPSVYREKEIGIKNMHEILLYDFAPWGGESFDDFRLRISDFINSLQQKHKSKVILIVTHGAVIRLMYDVVKGEKLGERLKTASIHEFNI